MADYTFEDARFRLPAGPLRSRLIVLGVPSSLGPMGTYFVELRFTCPAAVPPKAAATQIQQILDAWDWTAPGRARQTTQNPVGAASSRPMG